MNENAKESNVSKNFKKGQKLKSACAKRNIFGVNENMVALPSE